MKKENFKYKKQVAEALEKINDEMFLFRHAFGLKQLTNEDPVLKKKIERLQIDLWNLQNEIETELKYTK
jgi:hypothetical protein